MDPENARNWGRVREVFLDVVDLPAEERAAALGRVCGDDEVLQREVVRLLSHDDDDTDDTEGDLRAWKEGGGEARTVEGHTEPTPGVRVGRYLVEEVIGRGGMGVVCAAVDPTLERRVALKLVRAEGPGGPSQATERDARLLREAKGLAQLSHPNVVTVHDSGFWEDRLWIAMDLIDGKNLEQWVAEQQPPLEERVRVLCAAGRGLAAAHEAGLLHRDFKPLNVMVGPGERVRVVDFGLVRRLEASVADGLGPSSPTASEGQGATRTGAVLGTPGFVAPEVFHGQVLDARSDQYAFCVTLYRLVYGRLPTSEGGGLAALRQTLDGALERPAPRGLDGRVPGWLRAALEQGLQADPMDRHPDMSSLIERLERGLDRPRRQRAALLAAGGVAISAALSWAVFRGDDGVRCRGEEQLAGVWTTERSERSRADLAEGPGWVAATGTAVLDLLDDRAGEWAEDFRDACEATHVEGSQSPAVLDLRMACLDQRRDEMAAVVELLEAPEGERVEPESLRRAAASMSPLADCRDTVALRATTPPLRDPEARGRVAEARTRLAEVRIRRLAVDHTGAASALKAARTLASELDWSPLLAEVELEDGLLADAESRYADARRHLLDALGHALESRYDRVAVRTLAGLAWVDAYRRENVDRGRDWQSLVRAPLARLREAEELELELGLVDGAVAFAAGELEGAQAAWSAALDRSREVLGSDHPTTLDLVLRLAGVLSELGRLDAALELVEEGWTALTARFGPEHPLLGTFAAQRGTIRFRQGELEEAEADFRLAVKILEAAHGRRHVATITALHNLAWVLFQSGAHAEGIALQEEVLALQEGVWGGAHADVALAHANLAEMHLAAGDGDAAIASAESALETTRAIDGHDAVDLVVAASNLGYTLLAAGRPEHAIAPLEEALYLGVGRIEPARLAGARFLLARARRDAGFDPERTREIARTARQEAAAGGAEGLVESIDEWLQSREDGR